MGNRLYLFGCTLVAALGGLLFGFDTAVISGTEKWLQEIYGLSDFWLGFTVASALVGTIVGSVAAGRPADLVGRRATLIGIGVFYLVSAVGSALAWDWHSLLLFRFLGGLSVGGSSVVAPMYIAEISPARYRGRLVAVTQFNIVLGILLAFFSNFLINRLDLGPVEWRWMFGVEAFPAAAFSLLLLLTPRSPRWLVAGGRVDEARQVLARLGTDTAGVDEAIREIQDSLDLAHHRVDDPFFRRVYLRPILLAVAIATFNQLSGINALMYYAPRIFTMAGVGQGAAMGRTVVVGMTNLVFTMIALAVIDHFGRKKLMLVGSIGYIVSLAATAWAFYTYAAEFEAVAAASEAVQEAERSGVDPASRAGLNAELERAVAGASAGGLVVLVSLLVFIASHAFGQGAVIWVFISEVFPNRVRARGQALGSFTHWFMCAAVSWTFPVIADWSGGHAFAFYAAMMILQLLWVVAVMPETKGVPLEKIQKQLGIE
ncbi:MAG TPA: MFS transporter [Planctomycetaceae bacterium]|nr:MFS transporter [Planctomycetaceae bacterium]HIQ23368.1 MFS transporter [Planctomycetota bacterium]